MDYFDEDLQSMMGGMHQDETVPQQMPVMEQQDISKEEKKKSEVPVDEYVPIPKAQRGLIDRLYSCMVWLLVCGGIAMLLWWFWQNGLMAMEAAYPCILACGVIGSFGAGMNFRK